MVQPVNYWTAGLAPVPPMDRWRKLDVAYSEVTAGLFEHCSEEMYSRTFPSRSDTVKPPYRRLAASKPGVARRSDSFDSSLAQVDDRGQRLSVNSWAACLMLEIGPLRWQTRLPLRLGT